MTSNIIKHIVDSRFYRIGAEDLHYREHIGGVKLSRDRDAKEHTDICNTALER